MRDARLTGYAKAMRKRMTEPETRVWLQVRVERFEGVKFRRQKVIGTYIADFAATEPRLVVKNDGQSAEGRRVGTECVSPRRPRWSTNHEKKKENRNNNNYTIP